MNDNWVKVYTTAEFIKAEIAQRVLQENNIETYLMDRSDSAYVHLSETQIFVPGDQAAEAVALLKGINEPSV